MKSIVIALFALSLSLSTQVSAHTSFFLRELTPTIAMVLEFFKISSISFVIYFSN